MFGSVAHGLGTDQSDLDLLSRDKQRLADYLEHIVEAINRIERYVQDMDEADFTTTETLCGLRVG